MNIRERDSRSYAAMVRSTPFSVPDKTAVIIGVSPGPKHKEICALGVNLYLLFIFLLNYINVLLTFFNK